MPQSQDDRAQVAQLALDVKPLQPFFHPEDAPDRKPLLILKNDQVPDQPRLMKFGQPVRYVTRAETGGKPYLEFTLLKIEGDAATVEFSYPVEGVVGRVSLTKSTGAWKVESQSIRER